MYSVRIYDYDGNDTPPNPDDYIDGYQFSFASLAAAGYPTSFTLQNAASQLKVELTLQWQ
jgi:hypothetical protein